MVLCCNTINKIRDVRYRKRKVFVIKCMFGILSMGKKLILEICKKLKKQKHFDSPSLLCWCWWGSGPNPAAPPSERWAGGAAPWCTCHLAPPQRTWRFVSLQAPCHWVDFASPGPNINTLHHHQIHHWPTADITPGEKKKSTWKSATNCCTLLWAITTDSAWPRSLRRPGSGTWTSALVSRMSLSRNRPRAPAKMQCMSTGYRSSFCSSGSQSPRTYSCV